VLFKEVRSCIRTDAFVAEYCLIGDAGDGQDSHCRRRGANPRGRESVPSDFGISTGEFRLAALVAVQVPGRFEERLQAVVVDPSTTTIHFSTKFRLVGAVEGGMDATNLLKPALLR
jgi:ATP-dependent Clp protease ATP-binding subunit ClpA